MLRRETLAPALLAAAAISTVAVTAQSARVDFSGSFSVLQIANSRDAIVLDRNVPGESSPAGTIDNPAVTNDDVVLGRGGVH